MKVTDTYEWAVHEEDANIVKIGITAKAQKEIGEIVYIRFPEVGQKVSKGDELLVLESTKSAIDTYSPICGVVVEVNPVLKDLHHLNSDPEGLGWLIKVKPTNIDQYHALEDYSMKL